MKFNDFTLSDFVFNYYIENPIKHFIIKLY